MVQVGGGGDLAQEALGAEFHRHGRPEHLDGDHAIVLEVVSEVDRGHPAMPQLPLDAVAVTECGGKAIQGHRFLRS